MELNGKYRLSYTLDREFMDMVVEVELRKIEGLMKKGQNVWEGFAKLNGREYFDYDLTHCINARLAAERIGHDLREDIKATAKKVGTSFRVKKEELI
jgi:hypothetical protein